MKSFVPLIRSEWQLLLFGFAMTFGSSLGQTYFISLFSGEMRADLNLSHGDFGAVYSAATLASAILLLWTGGLIDRMDLRRFSYFVIFGLAGGCFLLASSEGIITLFIAILALRHMGQGLMSMAGTTTMVRYIDGAKGKANALSGIGYSISEAVLPSLVIALLLFLSWRQSWVFWGLALLLILPLLVRWLLAGHGSRHDQYLQRTLATGDASSPGAANRQRQWTRNEMLLDPLFYLWLPALLAMPLLFTGFMFHQVHLVEAKQWPLPLWGTLYIIYALTTSATKLVAGVLVDRFTATRMMPVMILPMAVALGLLASSSHLAVAVGFMCLMGMAVGTYSTVASPFYAERYGTLHLGSIKSLTTALMVFSSALSPVAMGWGIDAGISMETMAVWGLFYVLGASLLARLALRFSRRGAS
ncbi:MFS transporter [Halieaceae bacterium]|nr:MFS transporter [Halieaceae bacterium]